MEPALLRFGDICLNKGTTEQRLGKRMCLDSEKIRKEATVPARTLGRDRGSRRSAGPGVDAVVCEIYCCVTTLPHSQCFD